MTSSRWLILAVCIVGFMQTHVHRVGFAPLIPTFIADLGISYVAAGTIMTAYFWTYAAVQVPVGLLADRLGARRVMLTFMSVLVLGVVAFTLSRTYAQSLLGRCLIGLGTAGVWLPGLRLINEWFPAGERARATGLFSAGGGIGGTTALLAIPLLSDRLGWRWGYAVLLVPVLVTLVLIFLVIHPSPAPPARPAGAVAAATAGSASARGPLAALTRVLRTRALWPFNISVLLSYGAYISLITWLPAFLVHDAGLSRGLAGLVTALITAGTIVSWPLAGLISDRLGRRKPIYLFSQAMSAAVCLGFALLVPGSGLAAAAPVAALAGLLLGGMVTPFVMVTELYPPELVGTASGVVNTFCFIGSLIVPVGLGYILDLTGSFPGAFIACAAVQALAFVSALFTRETGVARRAMMA
jgi:MFS family permease